MLAPYVSIDDTTLTISLEVESWPYQWSWGNTPSVQVSPTLGALADVKHTGQGVTITITLAAEPTDGTVTLSGVALGVCYSESCPVDRVFDVTFPDGGAPEIALGPTAPSLPLQHLPKVGLALVEARGTEARFAVTSASPAAELQFDVSAGAVCREGDQALWTLPEQPGLYQIEVVVRDGTAVATDALVVEVRTAEDAST